MFSAEAAQDRQAQGAFINWHKGQVRKSCPSGQTQPLKGNICQSALGPRKRQPLSSRYAAWLVEKAPRDSFLQAWAGPLCGGLESTTAGGSSFCPQPTGTLWTEVERKSSLWEHRRERLSEKELNQGLVSKADGTGCWGKAAPGQGNASAKAQSWA